ncbi:MAG TPA: hypothetical protein PK325_03065 [Cyclobacteriaceae bacterium]|nr:hypothetical protein [Cyclobacteriaceae bacterium]HMV10879.1 hypothetical protein [Cyclobacteriaceae bacterium]HMV88892.1 hypothetical protein [Cyclobacteriaceae bacterium]HMW99680.1 hypothetical protein [Cyclobacteriaceae bacterium]HMX52002.1 hypothetical protein [Cyclobacteriaceae bacterium]
MKTKIFFILLCIGTAAVGQDSNVSMGYVKTELEKSAVNFAVDYAKNLTQTLAAFKGNTRSLLSFTPEIKVLVGSNDSFNGITAKYVGNIMVFDTTSVGVIHGVPNLGKTFHNFPIAVGFESDQRFTFVNVLTEIGYVPWYQNDKKIWSGFRQTKVGVFLQAGYKKAASDSTQMQEGGAADESEEKTDSGLFRVKLSAGFSPTIYFNKQTKEYGFSLIGNGNIWYDFLNSAVYYKIAGKLRLILKKDYYLDFGYEKGSGAPNFNEGEQFTTNLTIRF